MPTLPDEQLQYGPPHDEREEAAVERILALSFGGAPDSWPQFRDRIGGIGEFRVLRTSDGRLLATLGMYRMGQRFGERVVPCAGVAGVGAPPEFRGQGNVQRLMAALVRELAADGEPLSSLYPANAHLYRKAGYELCGAAYRYRIPAAAIGLRGCELAVRPAGSGDRTALEALQRAFAAANAGMIERTPGIWQRQLEPWGGRSADAWLVGPEGRPEGYVAFRTVPADGGRYDLDVRDFVALTGAALRSIWGLLAAQSVLARDVTWLGPAVEPRLLVLPTPAWTVAKADLWMLRIIDFARAVAARGWHPGAAGSLLVALRDEIRPEQAGVWRLHVTDGSGTAERVASGAIADGPILSASIQGLAALYGGGWSPTALRAAGLLEGGDDAMRLASILFAGPSPWVAEGF